MKTERLLPVEDLAAWWNAQERIPTVAETREHFFVSQSTAYARIIEAEALGLIERRTREDAWSK